MNTIRTILLFLISMLIIFPASAQSGETVMIGNVDTDPFPSRLVWDENGEGLTVISRARIRHFRLSGEASEPEEFTIEEKNLTLTTLSETGTAAALSEDRQTIIIYEDAFGAGKTVKTIEPGFKMLSVSLSEDGSSVLADSADQIRTVIYNCADGSMIHDLSGFQTAAPVYDSTLSADGNYVVWHSRGTFAVQNVTDGSFGETISLWDFAADYALSPDSTVLAVGIINDDYESGAVLFFDPQSGSELGRVLTGKTAPFALSYNEDGSVLWAADADKLYRIDPKTFEAGEQITVSSGDPDRVRLIASSPDGSRAAVLLNNGNLATAE